jgi:hypothetical protein
MRLAIVPRCAAVVASLALLAGCGGAGAPSLSPPPNANQMSAGRVADAPGPAAKGLLYVANLNGPNSGGEILVYSANLHAKNQVPIRSITAGANRPNGIWVDGAGVLYVVNEVNGAPNASVAEYRPGASQPFRTITDGLALPETIAVDAKGTVYVGERTNNIASLTVYAPRSVHPARTINLNIGGYALQPGGMAFDAKGNLLVAVQVKLSELHIFKVGPGASQGQELRVDLTGLSGPGLALDGAGNMYVGSAGTATVAVFAPGATKPTRTISSVAAYGLLTANGAGALYTASESGSIGEVAPGASRQTNTIGGPAGALFRSTALGR